MSALQALIGLLEPAVGAQVRGLVECLLPPKPAAPAPVTPTHAQIVAKLHKLYDSETQLVRKADEVEGRVEKVRAKLVEEEAALAKVQRELQGVKDQITASLRDDMSVGSGHGKGVRTVMGWRMLLLLKRVRVRRRWLRKVRGGRFGGKGVFPGGEGLLARR